MLTLIMPTEKNRSDVLAFYNEFEQNHETCIGYGGYKNYDAWLCAMQNRKSGKNLPKGYVRENFYLCYAGDEMVGVFSLKFELTEYLLHFGGHVGYAVKPSKRRCGYATQILKLGLQLAQELGFHMILAVCDEDNVASECVILQNGGILEDTLYDSDERVFVKRYWIRV